MSRAYHPVLDEIRDENGVWHTGWAPFGKLAQMVGTTTHDLLRRLSILGMVEFRQERHRLTMWARQKSYGMIYRPKSKRVKRLEIDIVLPRGMVFVVTNLERTNLPQTEAEKLAATGLSQRAIAMRLGVSQQAVQKRLATLPPRLKDWPILGSWDDDGTEEGDNPRACAA
jgi:hypothetical protein